MAFEKEAEQLFERATTALREGRLDEADTGFAYLLDRNPKNAELWYYAGTVALGKKHHRKALLMLNQALALEPGMTTAWNNMGVAHKGLLERDSAIRCFEKALEMFPPGNDHQKEKAQILSSLGGMYSNSGHPEKGVAMCEEAYLMLPDDHDTTFNLSLLYLELGRWGEGFDHYVTKHIKDKDYQNGLPIWDGTAGQTIVIYGEQGVGDEIMFASIIPDVARDCKVVFDCHPRLQTMFQRSFQSYLDMAIYGTRKVATPKWAAGQKLDARTSVGNLAKFYRRNDSDFPRTAYLEPDPDWVERLGERLKPYPSPRIAIAWKGGYQRTHKDKRSIPAEQLLGAVRGAGEVWSLQYTPEAVETAKELGIHHWQDVVDSLEMTAAFVQHMDLVITVNQSLAHLCGALGKECWVLTPKACAWRYGLSGPRMPFYGDWVMQYRQGDDERWEPVLERVREELWKRFRKSIAA